MKAVVMAGGEGSRLRPITVNRPKPLVPVCNQPIMEHILTLLKRHGMTDVLATLFYLADEVQGYFGDGADFGVKMAYTVEETPLGTAGSVKQAEHLLKDSPFLIISGDALTDCDLSAAIAFHKQKNSAATLILYHVPTPLEFGVVITDEQGRIVRFLEKPGWSEVFSDTVNTGMYILEPKILESMEPNTPYDWSGDIFPKLLADGNPMFGYVMEGYWTDIGTLDQYREAQEDMLSGRVNLPICQVPNFMGSHVGTSTSIDDRVELTPPVCIGDNVRIKAGARVGPFAVIGDNSLIEEDASIERSVLWDGAYIGAKAQVQSAVLCSRVTVKRDCVINEDAVIGDKCLLDAGSVIRPRVKLWPDKLVERGATVTMSLVYGNKWRGQLFRDLGVAGISNIELTPDFACRLGSAFGSSLPARSKVVTSRDSTRSSRMIKRAIIASLLSSGCDVLDLRSAAVPIARHFIKASGAAGAINTRKLPGNVRVTLVEMLDHRGAYLPRNLERKVESAFSREDFRRADPDDLGVIEFASRATEEYQADFMRNLTLDSSSKKHLRLVCDYGYSALASIYPAMLAALGVESITLNGFNDARMAPRTPEQISEHMENVRAIVNTLGYDMGMLFTDEGERLTVVDNRGRILQGNVLFAALCVLVAETQPGATIGMSVTAPDRLESELKNRGAKVVRTKAEVRALMNAAMDEGLAFAGDERGGYIFPEMHPGFDAAYSFGKLLYMLQRSGAALGEIVDSLPEFHLAYAQVRSPWEAKGSVMRRLSEESHEGRVELVDGIKIYDRDRWVLVLPDALEPLFHVYAEAAEESVSRELVGAYTKKIEELQKS